MEKNCQSTSFLTMSHLFTTAAFPMPKKKVRYSSINPSPTIDKAYHHTAKQKKALLRRQIGRFVSKSKSPKRLREIYPNLIFYPTTFSSAYTQDVELFSPPSTSHTSPTQLPTAIFTYYCRLGYLPTCRALRRLTSIVLNCRRLSCCATIANGARHPISRDTHLLPGYTIPRTSLLYLSPYQPRR